MSLTEACLRKAHSTDVFRVVVLPLRAYCTLENAGKRPNAALCRFPFVYPVLCGSYGASVRGASSSGTGPTSSPEEDNASYEADQKARQEMKARHEPAPHGYALERCRQKYPTCQVSASGDFGIVDFDPMQLALNVRPLSAEDLLSKIDTLGASVKLEVKDPAACIQVTNCYQTCSNYGSSSKVVDNCVHALR